MNFNSKLRKLAANDFYSNTSKLYEIILCKVASSSWFRFLMKLKKNSPFSTNNCIELQGIELIGLSKAIAKLSDNLWIEKNICLIRSMISRIISCVFLLTCWSFGSSNPKQLLVSEAELIVLEATNELLPPSTLSQTVEHDLKAIRTKFPAVADIMHIPKWHPGKLIFSNVQNETLYKIHKSCYGPISYYPLVGNTLVYFGRPYNAPKLAKQLEEEFQIGRVTFNQVIGRTSAITLIGEAFGNRTYVFYTAEGYCTPACKDRQYITFAVNPEENSIQLLDNEGLSLKSQCEISRKRSTS